MRRSRTWLTLAASTALAAVATLSRAQEPEPPPGAVEDASSPVSVEDAAHDASTPLSLSVEDAAAPVQAVEPEPPPPRERGLSFGVRVSYALPLGKLADVPGAAASGTFAGAVPFTLDVGYRFHERLYAGVFAEYAYGIVSSDACPGSASCSALLLRGGLDAQFHFLPRERFDPWAGVGAGYQYARIASSFASVDTARAFHGLELFELLGGVDWRPSPRTGLGLLATLSIARYNYALVDGDSTPIETATHLWLTLGVRGYVEP